MSARAPSSFPAPLERVVLDATGATGIAGIELVQTLWSGYGQLLRCRLEGGDHHSVIAKHVHWPTRRHHPRGWTSDRSHERKVRSYEVETSWYQRYASRCGPSCRVPRCLAVDRHGDDEVFLVLEDLDPAGFAVRRTRVRDVELEACLSWLAHFHATFLGTPPDQLWQVGTYWHLATRPDELAVLDDGPLKRAAAELDRRLSASPFLTLVHGDAKLANFCFSGDGGRVAAVDFQYVGGGCGMKDVAYFLGSCLDEDEIERREAELLELYFARLRSALIEVGNDVDAAALEGDWRELYPVAWTDFFRFLQGWSPGHWKIHRYSERLAGEVLARL